jgi:hypothetical protein
MAGGDLILPVVLDFESGQLWGPILGNLDLVGREVDDPVISPVPNDDGATGQLVLSESFPHRDFKDVADFMSTSIPSSQDAFSRVIHRRSSR